MRYLFMLFAAVLFVSCSNETPKDLSKQVDQLISEDNYTKALDMLNNADASDTKADISSLKEKTHLNYGLYLEYRGPKDSSMRDRMTSALKQYIAVLKLNPHNQKARSEIQQIMGIYNTMPNKSPGDDIISELNNLGFDFDQQ